MELLQLVGMRLREARQGHKIPLAAAADRASMAPEVLARIEAGQADPMMDEVRSLARIYSVSLDYLAGLTNPGWEFHYTGDGEVELVEKGGVIGRIPRPDDDRKGGEQGSADTGPAE